ncbi:histidine kinase [Flavobacteriaceae bacterium]|nr:histidine kinase [Flavobacteriaceae bacterium]MDC1219447.1 histidine kinase [Flavobacteriaceae bacterium]MDC1473177.1 histidine kinase [Flavobacteriaceae bacterium]MDC6456168.1 histidine kinase [Flavobacteriaceae bacterium]
MGESFFLLLAIGHTFDPNTNRPSLKMHKILKATFLIVLIFMGVYFSVFYTENQSFESLLFVVAEAFIYAFSMTYFNNKFHIKLAQYFPWNKRARERLLIGGIGSTVINMLAFFIIRFFKGVLIAGKTVLLFIENENPSYYIVCFVFSVLATFVYHLIYFYKSIQDKKLASHKIKEGRVTAQLGALKNQLDPHFLFNSLNVLTSLIEESPEKAQQFTTTLSRVYRYVLENKEEDTISLEEEFKFAKAYMKLLKMRFEDGLQYHIPASPSYNHLKIAPLSLQLLLENAIKHNSISEASPLEIRVYEEDGYLFVSNNIQLKKTFYSSGIGLQNIIKRYKSLTDKEVLISDSDNQFVVQLPILINSNFNMQTTDQLLDEKRYLKAKAKVQKIIGFYYHLFFYVLIISGLAWLNYQTTDFPWVVFPMLGWGFGLTGHGLTAFDRSLFFGKEWEQRRIEKIMAQEERLSPKFKKES